MRRAALLGVALGAPASLATRSSVSAVSVVIVASTRIKRNHYFKVRGISRDYHRIKEVVEI